MKHGCELRSFLLHPALAILLPFALAVVALAYQVDTAQQVDVGSFYDRVYIAGMHEHESTPDGQTFRWTTERARVRFPALGARDRLLVLRLHGYRPAGRPSPQVRVLVNDLSLATLQPGPNWEEARLFLPAEVGGASPEIVLEAETFVPAEVGAGGDPRALGVALDRVRLEPPAGSFSPGRPVASQVGWGLLIALAVYLGLGQVELPPRWAALAAGAVTLAVAWFLAFHRLWMTIDTHRLAVVLLLGTALLPLLRLLFGRIFAWGRVPLGEKEMRLLLAVFLLGFWVKAAGLVYPYSVAWDLLWHLEKAQRVVEGRLAEIYRPGAFSESVMPPEWGEQKPMIPYSPFYHITAALFFYLPWRPYDTANVLSVLLDTTRPFLLYFLALRLGLRRRVGLWAGLLYALLPATFLLHAWGNAPTTTGLWWTLASTCYLVGGWERLNRPRTWAGLTLFFLGTLLSYTVTATFLCLFVGILLLGLWANGRRLASRPLLPIFLSLLAALGLATAIYYGQYIRPMLEVTLPYFRAVARGEIGAGVVPVPWSQYLRDHLTRLSSLRYGLIWPLFLALGGVVVGWRQFRRPLLRWVLLAWFGTAGLFFLVGLRVDMVDKEIFYLMPALTLCAALLVDYLWKGRPAGRVLVLLLLLFLLAASLHTWISRLSTKQQEWLLSDAPIVGQCPPRPAQGVADTPPPGRRPPASSLL